MPDIRKQENFLLITAHDFRTPRWASAHFIVEQLAKRGKVRVFSMRYSWLSRWRADPRHVLGTEKANRVERFEDVECYLWKTLLHPVNLRLKFLEPLEKYLYRLYVALAPHLLGRWIREADTVIVESGTGPVFFPRVMRLNPRARLVYLCSDPLDTLHCDRYIRETLYNVSPRLDACIVCSRLMTSDFAPDSKIYFVPHGIDNAMAALAGASPYGGGLHAVSVGSMLFDAAFFEVAGRAFPEITFHVIGCGSPRPSSWPANIRHYDEMKFADTVPYIKYAAIGLAPYLGSRVPLSMADTSMKLMQYGYFGVPAVCPVEVVGDYAHRFGYKTGDAESIVDAVRAALQAGHTDGTRPLDWQQVAARVLEPEAFPDTSLQALRGGGDAA